jgi:hypothetical protein
LLVEFEASFLAGHQPVQPIGFSPFPSYTYRKSQWLAPCDATAFDHRQDGRFGRAWRIGHGGSFGSRGEEMPLSDRTGSTTSRLAQGMLSRLSETPELLALLRLIASSLKYYAPTLACGPAEPDETMPCRSPATIASLSMLPTRFAPAGSGSSSPKA